MAVTATQKPVRELCVSGRVRTTAQSPPARPARAFLPLCPRRSGASLTLSAHHAPHTHRPGPWPRSTIISTDSVLPISFESVRSENSEYLADPLIGRLVEFFHAKGRTALAHEDRHEEWYQDWIDFQAQHGIYASLLAPKAYSSRGGELSLFRLVRFLEVFACFSPAHAYSFHVSFLGLFPIYMSSNEALKREAVARLEGGGLFALGVSERAHGADLLANEFFVTPADAGYVASGSKYYIGNANAACMVSILGKKLAPGAAAGTKRAPLMFFALRPADAPAYRRVNKIRTLGIRAAFVGEFRVDNHLFPETDVIADGREAWDAVFGTVNLGKFFLGFGAVGMCEQSFAEAVAYLRGRTLYGKPAVDMPHIRRTLAIAYARLVAMKLYAYRALDYFQSASADDRRFLLFSAVQKARVSTQGVRVVELLSECVGARGFEMVSRIESALREAPMVPVLEGSTHINFGLTAQFIAAYFAKPSSEPVRPPSIVLNQVGGGENPYWFDARDRNAKTVAFADALAAYPPLRSVANVRIFTKQVKGFRRFFESGLSGVSAVTDTALQIALGRCFSALVYGQLVAESCALAALPTSLISFVFQCLVEDLSTEALQLSALFEHGSHPRELLGHMIRLPRTAASDVDEVAAAFAARYT